MAYTTINKGSSYFNTKLYTGNLTNNTAITGLGFQPDLVWIKSRSNLEGHNLFDVVRGTPNFLNTASTNAQDTDSSNLQSFDSDGFTLGTRASINGSGTNFVAWNWKAGGTGVSNTDGSITSTVSANTTSGFSIVSYTGNGTAGATVGHGLGAKPSRIIVKVFSGVSNESWWGYHKSLGATKNIYLNATDAAATSSAGWNDTEPTSSVFTLGNYSGVNGSGYNFIAYCWTDIKGFSKFGSHTGNGSTDGTFVYTGFKPAYLLVKITSGTTNDWTLLDNARSTYNVAGKRLYPNANYVEDEVARADFLSNGFKLRGNGSDMNASGYSYIYHAFAEHPLVSSTGTPCTAI